MRRRAPTAPSTCGTCERTGPRATSSLRRLESSVAFSPDGRTLAAGGSGGSIRLWDLRTRRPIGALEGHADDVTTVTFSPDGRLLASASFDGTVRLWNVRSHRQLGGPLERGFSAAYGLAFSPDGRLLAVAGPAGPGRSVRLWDTRTRRQFALVGGGNAANGVAFSPDGRWLVAAGADGAVRVWDVRRSGALRRTLRGPRGSIFTSVAVSRAGVVAASTGDGEAWLWRLPGGTAIGTPLQADSNTIRTLAFSPDGGTLATGGSVVRLWGVATHHELGAPLTELRATSYHGVSVSPTGTLAALDQDGSVRLWSLASNSPVRQTVKVDPSTSAITFTPDGRLVAAGRNGTAAVWDVGTGKQVDRLRLGKGPVGIAVSHDGRTLAAVDLSAGVLLWDLATRKKPERLAVGGAELGSVAFSPDGHTLALGAEDGTVRVGDLRAPDRMRSFPAGQGYIYAVAFSPDGLLLATSGRDGYRAAVGRPDPEGGRCPARPVDDPQAGGHRSGVQRGRAHPRDRRDRRERAPLARDPLVGGRRPRDSGLRPRRRRAGRERLAEGVA